LMQRGLKVMPPLPSAICNSRGETLPDLSTSTAVKSAHARGLAGA
jgi:hypothetical protein